MSQWPAKSDSSTNLALLLDDLGHGDEVGPLEALELHGDPCFCLSTALRRRPHLRIENAFHQPAPIEAVLLARCQQCNAG